MANIGTVVVVIVKCVNSYPSDLDARHFYCEARWDM